MSRAALIGYLKDRGIYSDNALAKMDAYCDLVLEANKSFNLTAITDRDQFYAKHFIDSLAGYEHIKDSKSVCDIGSGAGFPGVPLAIACPSTQFVLVDSLRKRVDFVNTCTKKLNITNCVAVHSRAEEFASSRRESFDVCTARAVSSLDTLAELCAPLVKVGGEFVAYKGKSVEQELAAASRALQVLGLQKTSLESYRIDDDETHFLLVCKKVRPTPSKYPRSGNKPKTHPIS